MGKRKVTILEPVINSVAEIAYFIEAQGLVATAKKFVDDVFNFFEKLSDERVIHKPCSRKKWILLKYRCVSYKKKYVIAYLNHTSEIIICDFVSFKALK